MIYLVLLDQYGEGPLEGQPRWGTEGEIAWKLVDAPDAQQAITSAFERDYSLAHKREPDEAQQGDADFPWHTATAVLVGDLRVTHLRMKRRVVTEYDLEIGVSPDSDVRQCCAPNASDHHPEGG
jgi:hypothetical protein